MIYILLVLSLWFTSWTIWRYYLLSSGAEYSKPPKVEKAVPTPTPVLVEFYDDIKNDFDEDPPTVVMPRSGNSKIKQ